jgi:hypothetical protein
MSFGHKRWSAVLLASALAFSATSDAYARGFGGGGGGGHFGGGGFGGGGGHFGGFGGGGMRMGGFGGGGMRMGGFGGMRMGGAHFGGMRMGGMHVGGMRMGHTAFHSAGHGFHVGNRSFAHNGFGAHHFAGSHANAAHALGAHNLGHAAAAAGAAHLAGRNFAHAGNLAHGPGNNWHNNWHGHFPATFPGFRGWWGYGWYGPVFWPFAYDVLWASLFWPWYYDYPFWAYGYPDIYAGLFWPYGYDDLGGYLAPGPGPIAGSYGGVSGPAVAGGAGGAAPSTRFARGAATGRQAEVTGNLNQSCGEDSKEVAGWPIDKIEQTVNPTADQRVLLDDFANASIRAAQAIKEACPTNVSFAPTGRMDAMQKRIAGMVQAIDIVRQPLGKFYDALSDEQKARLNATTDQNDRSRSLANCGAASSATQWPGERIEKAVQPNAQQQVKLDALKNAMADAANALSSACPASLPATPPARLDAIAMRLNTMLQSVSTVRGALDDFYNSLSDEQKAQFNRIGRQQQTAQQG